MDNVTQKLPAVRLSRSGLWLIGGALLLSVVVLVWALQGDSTDRPAASIRPPRPGSTAARSRDARPVARPATPGVSAAAPAAGALAMARPPAASEYSPLLQGNLFQPRVVPPRDQAGQRSASSRAAVRRPVAPAKAKPAGPQVTDGWNDWKYTGTAQLDQHTYALMDQAAKKESRFVKVGDSLDDATIVLVAENEVTLRQADGALVHVKRVDPAAELRRAAPAAPTAPAAPGTVPAVIPQVPSQPGFAPGAGTAYPNGQSFPQNFNGAPAGGDTTFGRRGRRFQQNDAGGPGGQ